MRVAILADAPGNLLAFEAVLADLRAQAPDMVVNLGDLFSGPYDPAGSADAQIALAWPTVAGNQYPSGVGRLVDEDFGVQLSALVIRRQCRQRCWRRRRG